MKANTDRHRSSQNCYLCRNRNRKDTRETVWACITANPHCKFQPRQISVSTPDSPNSDIQRIETTCESLTQFCKLPRWQPNRKQYLPRLMGGSYDGMRARQVRITLTLKRDQILVMLTWRLNFRYPAFVSGCLVWREHFCSTGFRCTKAVGGIQELYQPFFIKEYYP